MMNEITLLLKQALWKNFPNKIKLHSFGLLLLALVFFSLNTLIAQTLASGKSKFVGNIVGFTFNSNFLKYWNQVTAENAGKWGSVEYTQGSYNWTQLDNIYNYAVSNNLPYKHHCLIWGNQQPSFLSSLDSASQYQEVENWIKETGQRYPLAAMCDVVNEPLHAQPVYKNALGGDGTTGWDWVIKSFELARKYWSSNTKLLINEYSVLNDGSAASRYVQIINLLKDRGLIDGIGIQAHSFEVDGPSLATLKSNLDKIAATGLPIFISEFDINESDDNTQLKRYQSIFPLLYEEPGVQGITLWGYIQDQIWQADAYLINNRKAERPALQWLRTYLAAPFRPILISPNGTTNESLTPQLTWHSSAGAASYHVQVSNNSAFSSTIADTTVSDTVVILKSLPGNTRLFWHVSSISDKGESPFTDAFYFITQEALAVEDIGGMPTEYKLFQNYPNPFNPTTQIQFSIPRSGFVSLKVYNLIGQEVATMFEGIKQAGSHVVSFNSSGLSSGVYIYTLKSNNFVDSKKLILLK